MVISRLRIEKIYNHISFIQECIEELRGIGKMKEEEFISSKRDFAAAESFLRRALEAAFDIGRHIMAKSYGAKEIEYKAIAIKLGEKGVISSSCSEKLVKMAGYRNRLVHLYNEITSKELYSIILHNLSDIEEFIEEINLFLARVNNALRP